jgi:hypothetical protein
VYDSSRTFSHINFYVYKTDGLVHLITELQSDVRTRWTKHLLSLKGTIFPLQRTFHIQIIYSVVEYKYNMTWRIYLKWCYVGHAKELALPLWNRALLKNLIGSQAVNNFPYFTESKDYKFWCSTALTIQIFKLWRRVVLKSDTDHSKEYMASIFMVKEGGSNTPKCHGVITQNTSLLCKQKPTTVLCWEMLGS